MATKLPLAGQAEIPLDRILVSGENPRTHFDQEALEELARSIEKDGLLQSILVRPVRSDEEWPLLQKAKREDRLPDGWEDAPELDGALYELVSGERRLRAHQELDRDTIRAEIRPMSRKTAVRIRLIENVQREDLDELEEARAYQRMLDELEYDVEGIAEEVGKSISYVYQRLKLLELAEPVREALSTGDLTAGHAIEIARLPTPELQVRALKATVTETRYTGGETRTKAMSVRDLRSWIRQFAHLELEQAPWGLDDADLLPEAGSCTACPKRTGNAADLWQDVEDGATCTDPDCYQVKLENYLERTAAQLEEQGTPFVRVSTERYRVHSYNVGGDGHLTEDTLGTRSYVELEDGDACDHALFGLVMDGTRIGQMIDVCTEAGCEVHGEDEEEVDPDYERRQKAHKRNIRERGRRKNAIDTRLAHALLSEEELAPETRLELAFARLWDESWVQDQKAAAELLELEDHHPETAAKWSDGRSVEELARGFFVLSLARHFGGRSNATIPKGYGVRNLAPALAGLTVEEAKRRIREEASWRLPEDLFDIEWVLPARVDLHEPTAYADFHVRLAGDEDVFCGDGPEEVRVSDEKPDHWRWDACEPCYDHLLDLQTSALEEDEK